MTPIEKEQRQSSWMTLIPETLFILSILIGALGAFDKLDQATPREEQTNERDLSKGPIRIKLDKQPTAVNKMLEQRTIIATARAGDEVIHLKQPCGLYWVGQKSSTNADTQNKLKQCLDLLHEKINNIGIEIADGMYQTA